MPSAPVPRFVIPAVALAAMALGAVLYGSSGRDDNYITHGAAAAVVERGEIANIDGDRFEQSSTLLFTVATAATSAITGLAVPAAAMALGVLFGFLAMLLAGRAAALIDRRLQISVVLLTATSPPLVYWSFSGMEVTLAAVLLTWAAIGATRWTTSLAPRWTERLSMGGAFLAYAMVRPEAGFILVAAAAFVGGGLLLARGGEDPIAWRRWLWMFGAAVGACVLLLGFRRVYFGSWVPKSVTAKSSGLHLESVKLGLAYLWDLRWSLPALVPALAAVGLLLRDVMRTRRLPATAVPIGLLLASVAFVVACGGDWMEIGRLVAPMTPLLFLCALDACRRVAWRPALAGGTVALLALNSGATTLSLSQSMGIPMWKWREVDCEGACAAAPWFERYNHIHNRDLKFHASARATIGSLVSLRLGRPVVILSHQAGMVAYYLKEEFGREMAFVDSCGLVTDHVHTCPVTRAAKKTPAGKCTPIPELLEQRDRLRDACGVDPDVVFGLFPGTPAAKADLGREMAALGYRLVTAASYPASRDDRVRRPTMTTGEYLAVREDLAARLTP